jgi:hypothetical protein
MRTLGWRWIAWAACWAATLGRSGASRGGVVFVETFADGSAVDGNPVTWTPTFPAGASYEVIGGDYWITPRAGSPDVLTSNVAVALADVSIRVQGRISGSGGAMVVSVRNPSPPAVGNYFAGIGFGVDASAPATSAFLGKTNPDGSFTLLGGGGFVELPFDIRSTDGLLQLDVVGQRLEMRAWRAGTSRPASPLLFDIDADYAGGFLQIGGLAGNQDASSTVFRTVEAGDAPLLQRQAQLKLRVNTATGEVRLVAAGPDGVTLTAYQIGSAAGSVDAERWSLANLAARRLDAVGGGGAPGQAWEVVHGAPTQLFEAFLLGGTRLEAGREISLGRAYRSEAGVQDLTFEVGSADGEVLPGAVEYFFEPVLLADFDGDQTVAAEDLTLWAIGWGSGPLATRGDGDADFDGRVTGRDLLIWQQEFGGRLAASLRAVPEPSGAAAFAAWLASWAAARAFPRRLRSSPSVERFPNR